jgi:hypothetical protein
VLENVEMLVLDEADRMLDMGFIEDIEHIAEQLPRHRQTLMASATFAGEVGRLAQRLQKDDVERIEIAAHTEKHENISQEIMWADDLDHKHALLDHILTEREVDQAVVFTSTQIDADRLADRLNELGHSVAALHGGMPQGRRNRVLQGLRSRHLRILVATDVAARGIDVPTITHVINYGLPLKAEDYVHRIGRTGRAGRSGRAVTLAERRDVPMIKRIQHYTTQPIPVQTVAGLEPSRPAPDLFGRPARGGAPRGKNYGGQQGGGHYGQPRDGHFGGRGSHAGFGGRPGPRRDDPFGQGPHDRTNHERRDGGHFAPREGGHFERRDGGAPFGQREGFAPRDGGHFDRRPGGPGPRPFEHRGPRADRPQHGERAEGYGERPRFADRGDRPAHGGGFKPRQDGGAQFAGKSDSKPRWTNKGPMPAARPRKAV